MSLFDFINVRILEAARCSLFTDTGFSALTVGCHELQRLDLDECILVNIECRFELVLFCTKQ